MELKDIKPGSTYRGRDGQHRWVVELKDGVVTYGTPEYFPNEASLAQFAKWAVIQDDYKDGPTPMPPIPENMNIEKHCEYEEDGHAMYFIDANGEAIGAIVKGPSGRWATSWNMSFDERKQPDKFQFQSETEAVGHLLFLRDARKHRG